MERTKGYNYHFKTLIYKDGSGHDEENYFIIERMCKILLLIVRGYKFYISVSYLIASKLKLVYQENGERKFEYFIFKDVYEIL